MNQELQELKTELIQTRQELKRESRRARLSWLCALSALGCTLLVNIRPAVFAQAPGVTLASLQAAIVALQQKTAPITTTGNATSGYQMTISKANVQIVNGMGKTETQNGLGNLTVGYNETRGSGADARTGSHNIVTGELNNYTSSGGIVGGYINSLGGIEEFAVGAVNTVTGHQATIGGGYNNTTTGDQSSVTGGTYNTASGDYSSVTGGIGNTANGYTSSVSGGKLNTASGYYASVTGGLSNTASDFYGYAPTVAGPKGDTGAQGPAGQGFSSDKIAILNALSLSDGYGTGTELTFTGVNVHIVNGMNSTATKNGLGNLIIGYNEKDPQFTQDRSGSHNLEIGTGNNYLSYGGIVAGISNLINSPYASVLGGQLNVARSTGATVSGGYQNLANGNCSSISGGYIGTASGPYASISGGYSGIASGNIASISGGYIGAASGQYASISGGNSNAASGYFSSVSGGFGNTASASGASVSGGQSLTQSSSAGWSGGNYHSP